MKYEVTARMTIEADSPHHAIQLFDEEYRDWMNVVHLHAEAKWFGDGVPEEQVAKGERRNNYTVAY